MSEKINIRYFKCIHKYYSSYFIINLKTVQDDSKQTTLRYNIYIIWLLKLFFELPNKKKILKIQYTFRNIACNYFDGLPSIITNKYRNKL